MFLYLLNISCLFILFGVAFLYAEVCGSSLLWMFLPVGGVGWVACQGSWLGKLASVFWWVELVSSLWSAMKCPVVSFEVSMGLVWLLAACIFVLRFMFLLCWKSSLVCLALKLVGSWVVWFQCRYGGFWMSFCQLTVPGVRRFLVISSFGFSSGFPSYTCSSLKTSPSIQHQWQNT